MTTAMRVVQLREKAWPRVPVRAVTWAMHTLYVPCREAAEAFAAQFQQEPASSDDGMSVDQLPGATV